MFFSATTNTQQYIVRFKSCQILNALFDLSKTTIHHKGGNVPDGLLPVEFGEGARFCNGPSPEGNGGENDTLEADSGGKGHLPKEAGGGCGILDPGRVWMRVMPACKDVLRFY